MPTVSTVENTTSARLSGRSDESTGEVAAVSSVPRGRASAPHPPASPMPPAASLEVVADDVSALDELIQPVEYVAGRRAWLELKRRAPLGRVPEEVVERGHWFAP